MKRYSTLLISLLFGGMIVIWACKHQIPDPPIPNSNIPGQTGRACDSDSVYFANEILPLLKSTCATSGCHDAFTQKEGVQITSYATIMDYVVPSNANNSKLYEVITKTNKRMPPAPMAALTVAEIAKIKKWISQGAKDNACDHCDTLDYKFSTAVKPLLDLKCKGCHNTASLGGGIDLSTYAATKISASNGKLYGAVNWSTGFKAMPQNSAKMPSCEILQIKKWIDSGAPNN